MINLTGKQLASTVRRFLEIVQPLPVKYGYFRGIQEAEEVVTYYEVGSTYRRVFGDISSERSTFIVTVQTKTAKKLIAYSKAIEQGTEGSGIVFVSDSVRKDTTVKDGWINTIMLYVYTAIDLDKVSAQVSQSTLRTEEPELETTDDVTLAMKQIIEQLQPLPVSYSYSKKIKASQEAVTYYSAGTSYTQGIGNALVSERRTFTIYVRAKTAERNAFISELIKRGAARLGATVISDTVMQDADVKGRWSRAIVVEMYAKLAVVQKVFSPEEVRNNLQLIADLYLFVTSIYDETLAQSFIDRLVLPELDKTIYSYKEYMNLKREYLDRLIYNDVEY